MIKSRSLLYVGPLLNPIKVLERLVKRSPTINFVSWDVLDDNSFKLGRRNRQLAVSDVVPVYVCFLEKFMLLDFLSITLAGAKSLLRVAI